MRRIISVPLVCSILLAGSTGTAAGQAGILVEVECRATPETVRIVNSTAGSVTVRSVGSLVNPRPGVEPFARDDGVGPNDVIVYAFGPNPGAHAGAIFLTGQPIFDNDSPGEGVAVATSAGTARVLCSRGSSSVGQDQTAGDAAGAAAGRPAATPTVAPGQIPDRFPGKPGPAPSGAPGKSAEDLPKTGEPALITPVAIVGGSLLAIGLALRLDAVSGLRRRAGVAPRGRGR